MELSKATLLAEQISKKFNPKGLSPFPYQNILETEDGLTVHFTDKLPDDISGITSYVDEDDEFVILINNTKPDTKQHFTLAHELGHYFLHKDKVKEKKVLVSDTGPGELSSGLYSSDNPGLTLEYAKLETEANDFASALLMPESYVRKAWKSLGDIEACSRVFNVSVTNMSIRLEKLGLVE